MLSLDKVYSIWEDLDSSYENAKKAASRNQFLLSLLGEKNGTLHTEQLFALIKKDFIETPENVEKLRFLEKKIELASKLAKIINEIEILSLESAINQIASDCNGSDENVINIVDYQIDAMQETMPVEEFLKTGVLLTGTYKDEKGGFVSVDFEKDNNVFMQFNNVDEVTSYVLQTVSTLQNDRSISDFQASVVAYLVPQIVHNCIEFPCAFIAKNLCNVNEKDICLRDVPSFCYHVKAVSGSTQDHVKLVGGTSYDLKNLEVYVCVGKNAALDAFPLIVVGGNFVCP